MTTTKPKSKCPCCGELFEKVTKEGKIVAHDFPKPCRSVCRGSNQEPRTEDDDRPLWKDDPDQEAKEFYEAARQELLLYGFAVVKQMAVFRNLAYGTMPCPLCLNDLTVSIAKTNGHCRARCKTTNCINAME
jgi:hypothetical protein